MSFFMLSRLAATDPKQDGSPCPFRPEAKWNLAGYKDIAAQGD